MRPIRLTQAGVGSTAVVPLDIHSRPFNVGVGCILTGTATFTVEHTFDDPQASGFDAATANWLPNTGLTSKTASADGNYAFPVRAVRLTIASGAGSVQMTVIQATN